MIELLPQQNVAIAPFRVHLLSGKHITLHHHHHSSTLLFCFLLSPQHTHTHTHTHMHTHTHTHTHTRTHVPPFRVHLLSGQHITVHHHHSWNSLLVAE